MNVIGQIFLTDKFLGGEFLRYGIEVVQFLDQDPETRVDPMARVFPRITKCVFHKYGASGKSAILITFTCQNPSDKKLTFKMFRNNSKTRRTVHFGIEHHEREDLHFPLVLVHHLGLNHKRRFPRSTGHYLDVISENSSLADATLNTTKGRR